MPWTDAMLMIEPARCGIMYGRTSRVNVAAPSRLTLKLRVHCSAVAADDVVVLAHARGVVAEHVDPPARRGRRLHDARARRRRTSRRTGRSSPPARGADRARGVLAGVRVDVARRERPPPPRRTPRDRPADAVGPAGHDRDLVRSARHRRFTSFCPRTPTFARVTVVPPEVGDVHPARSSKRHVRRPRQQDRERVVGEQGLLAAGRDAVDVVRRVARRRTGCPPRPAPARPAFGRPRSRRPRRRRNAPSSPMSNRNTLFVSLSTMNSRRPSAVSASPFA